MNALVYMWIEGGDFSPTEFQESLAPGQKGTIEYSKKIIDGAIQVTRQHWKSKKYEFDNYDQAIVGLSELLTSLAPALMLVRGVGTQKVAELVFHYSGSNESHGGVFFSSELIQLMASVGVSVDVDEYFSK